LHQVYRLAVAALAVAAGLLAARLLSRRRASMACVALAAVMVALAWQPAWSPWRLSSGLFRAGRPVANEGEGPDAFFSPYEHQRLVPFYDDDPTSSVAVWELNQRTGSPVRAIINNGKSDGSIPLDNLTMALCAILPALLANNNDSAFVIGYGTGVTAGELAQLGSMRVVDVAEISSAVMRAAPFFDYGNLNASTNPKVHVLQTDAYRALMRSGRKYDIIASEPSNPWMTGVEMLYSREFLEAAREHLAPGGVYAQWFHLYETDTETVSLVLRTYKSVFANVAVWYALGKDLLLLGFQDRTQPLDLDRLESRVQNPEMAAALRRAGISGVGALLAHELFPDGVLGAMSLPGKVHTLFHPRLSDLAARAFFRHESANIPSSFSTEAAAVGSENSLLRRYAARFAGGLPDSIRVEVLKEVFKYQPKLAPALLAQWDLDHPESEQTAPFRLDAGRTGVDATDFPRLKFLLRPDPQSVPACVAMPRVAQLFEEYYNHAAPFDRQALRLGAERCAGDTATRGAFARLETLTGPLS